ncbi:MAG: hypothetical protein ACOC4Z_03050 [Patescibacteria group bacterium]
MSKFRYMEDTNQDSSKLEQESENPSRSFLFFSSLDVESPFFFYLLIIGAILLGLGVSGYLLRDQFDLSWLGLGKDAGKVSLQPYSDSQEATSSGEASRSPFSGDDGAEKEKNLPEGWKLYKTEKAGFAVGCPESVTPNESENMPGSVTHLVRFQPSGHSSLPLVTAKILGVKYVSIREQKDSQRLRDQGYTIDKIKVGDKKGLWIYGKKSDGEDTLYEVDFPTPDGNTLQIISVMSLDEEQDGVDMLKTMLESFTFL